VELSASRSRTVAGAVAVTALLLSGCSEPAHDPASEIVRTTTRIAGAAVVGFDRDTSAACSLPTPLDPGRSADGTHTVVHTSGVSVVPDDPRRIVVLDDAALDAVCALGLWERVVAATTGPDGHPDHLGSGVTEIPAAGSPDAVDLGAVEAAQPDLILGSAASPGIYDSLSAVAPTVTVGDDPAFWQDQFLRIGETLGRSEAARRVLDDYLAAATDLGRELVASQTQASLVRFTADGPVVEGVASFAGRILTDVGARRPPSQRFTVVDGRVDTPVDPADVTAADGDVIFVRFEGQEGLAAGTEYMKRDNWLDLGAVTDGRLFSVSDDVWTTPGPVAAHAVLTDLRYTLNGYSN